MIKGDIVVRGGTVVTDSWSGPATVVISGDRIYVAGASGLLYDLPVDPRKDYPLYGSTLNRVDRDLA